MVNFKWNDEWWVFYDLAGSSLALWSVTVSRKGNYLLNNPTNDQHMTNLSIEQVICIAKNKNTKLSLDYNN